MNRARRGQGHEMRTCPFVAQYATGVLTATERSLTIVGNLNLKIETVHQEEQ
jgi:hypothetical protein